MHEICLLHARSDRALRALVAEQLAKSNITMMEWLLLGVVSGGSGQGMTMSEIAKELHVTLPQVTALVNKLLPLKLIKQKTASNDRRSRRVTATSKGQSSLEDSNKLLDEAMGDWVGGIPTQQLQSYTRTLKQLANKA